MPAEPRPYQQAAAVYRERGWIGVLPLPPRAKADPPAGFTGYNGQDPSDAQIAAWVKSQEPHNICIRLPKGVVGIDVDAYAGKRGAETLAAAEKAWGPLPPTWLSTSREDDRVSGIRWFRVPVDAALPGKLAMAGGAGGAADVSADIEIILRSHRYAVVAPSVHPLGRPYRWRKPDGGWRQPKEPLPAPGDLPELPATWLKGLKEKGPKPDVVQFLAELPQGDPCSTMLKRRQVAINACTGGSRHDGVRDAVSIIVRLGEQGHPGAAGVLDEVVEAFITHVAESRQKERGESEEEVRAEFARMVQSAVKWCLNEPTLPEMKGCLCGGEILRGKAGSTEDSSHTVRWPEPLQAEAFHGLAGKVVRAIEPHTEADPAAILIQFLVGFGNLIGRHPYFVAESDWHHTNLFAVQVGETSKARKGTSWGRVRRLLEQLEPDWAANRIVGGLSSGEGLIFEVRDPTFKKGEETDPGVEDKRLLVFESEYSTVLKQGVREHNILAGVLRQAWETGNLRNMVVNSPRKATEALISIVGHITRDELLRHIQEAGAANGFGNRHLWFCARRSKLLPDGGGQPDFSGLLEELRAGIEFAHRVGELQRDEAAKVVWYAVYESLSAGKPGLMGAMVARAEAQVMRIAVIYAVLDCSSFITAAHLQAALAVWKYCEDSSLYIFGDKLGDPTADTILKALRQNAYGLTREQIYVDVFSKHTRGPEIDRALDRLVALGLIESETIQTSGRPATRWKAR